MSRLRLTTRHDCRVNVISRSDGGVQARRPDSHEAIECLVNRKKELSLAELIPECGSYEREFGTE